MLKRIKFFGFGFLLSILILSFTGGNRLSDTFLAYINYFNINKRVIYHLDKKEMLIFSEKSKCQMDQNKIEKKDISLILKNSKINFSKSERSNDSNLTQLRFLFGTEYSKVPAKGPTLGQPFCGLRMRSVFC